MMHMVSPSRIKELANQEGMRSVGSMLPFASKCYDEGMVEILKTVARKELYYHYEPSEPSEKVKQMNEQLQEQYQALEKTLNEEQKSLLREIEESAQAQSALEAGEEFINGFIRGYRFLKQEVAHGME